MLSSAIFSSHFFNVLTLVKKKEQINILLECMTTK